MTRKRFLSGAVVALLLSGATACKPPMHGPSSDSQQAAQRIWNEHIDVVRQIVAGKSFEQAQFVEAVEFLEKATGIPSRDDGTFVGRLPTKDLEEDLRRWEAWFAENQATIYWDGAAKQLKTIRANDTPRE